MLNIRTKITALFLILSFYKTGYGQLTLENIFLTDKYIPVQTDDIQFLHTKPLFARLINTHSGGNISFYNSKNEKTDQLTLTTRDVSPNNKNISWRDLIISHSDKQFLLSCNCEQLYRRSFFCHYFTGDEKGMLTPLSDAPQIYPTFSPDDKYVAFVKGNNLFYKNIADGKEVQITKDGEWNKIINGKSDWVYEEELELTRAYAWNAKSDKIAYLKFDEQEVKEYSIPMYYDMQYPNYFNYKYPCVGEKNSTVSVWLYDVKSNKNRQIFLPFSYEYIPRIYWNASGDEIIAMLLNRHQDSLQLVGYNLKTKKTRQLYLETDKAYVDIPETVQFLSDNSFIISSEKDGFNHLYHYDKDGKLIRQITASDNWEKQLIIGKKDTLEIMYHLEVTDVYGIDEKHKTIYFQANKNISTERNLFSVNYETLQIKPLGETFVGKKYTGVNTARFSNDFSFYIKNFSNITTPPLISIHSLSDTSSIIIEDNQYLRDSLLPMLPEKRIGSYSNTEGAFNTYGIFPKNYFSSADTAKYPVFFYEYAGPGNEEVINKWNSGSSNLFLYYLAQQGIEVHCIDPRGSGGKGAAFKKQTFLNLGKYETEDILDYVKFMKDNSGNNANFAFHIDTSRFGIFGWSYGGFMAANCLFAGNDVFKAAIAAAPVSNWNLYDDIYTEKYMRTPQENPTGYNSYNPTVLAKNLKGNLLLIHGTADDNVHFQHSIQLINALNAANKTYQLYIYPDAEHGTTGKKMRFDLYNKIYQFLKEKL